MIRDPSGPPAQGRPPAAVRLELATWNIGGGILGASHQRDGVPSLDHYAWVLRHHAPDVVCLQEAHDFHERRESQARELARRLGYPHVLSFPTSASHLVGGASLALAVLSRFPLGEAVYRQFPNLGLDGTGPDGAAWQLADKGYLITTIDLGGSQVGLINGHCFPLRYFGAHATESRFSDLWEMLSRDMMALNASGPAVVAVDLNHSPIGDVLSGTLGPAGYADAFADVDTSVAGAKQDFVLHGQGTRLLSARLVATESDHAYRQVGLSVAFGCGRWRGP